MAKAKEGQMVQLDPAVILADDNSRFGLKQSRIESLAADILQTGRVREAVEVIPISNANGHSYRLLTGFYRHAAILLLNKDGAGLTLPATVVGEVDPAEKVRLQITENTERENMSPMDMAIAMQRLMDAGLSRIKIREMFPRESTSKRGGKPQPASNAWLNIHLSFLKFPEKIQKLIHNGDLGVAAAYELTRVSSDKWDKVLEHAQAERTKFLEREDRDEEKYLKEERVAADLQAKADEAKKKLEEAEAQAKEDEAKYTTVAEKAKAAYEATQQKGLDAKSKKERQNAFTEAEKERKALETKSQASTTTATRVKEIQTKTAELAQEKAAKLKEARSLKTPAQSKAKAVSGVDVKKAAQEVGAGSGPVMLNASEMRKIVAELALPGSNMKITEIGVALQQCFMGVTTDKQLYKALEKVVGKK